MAERPMTWDHLKSQKKPNITKVRIALDSEIADAYEEAKEELERLRTRVKVRPDDMGLLAELDQAEETFNQAKTSALETSAEFVMRAVGRKRFDDLMAKHPPTSDQRKKAREDGAGEISWNPDTFPPALIHLSIVTPKMTPEEVSELWASEDWSGAETIALFMGAMEVNSNRRDINLGKG